VSYFFKCPACGSDEDFTLFKEDTSQTRDLLLFFGGVLPWLLFRSSARRRVQCAKCGVVFQRPPLPLAPGSRFSIWIIGIVVFFPLAIILLCAFPEIMAGIPRSDFVSYLETQISQNPLAVIIGGLSWIVVLLLSCAIAYVAFNHTAHKELRAKYQTEPRPYTKGKSRESL
jgi:hypothetical protein